MLFAIIRMHTMQRKQGLYSCLYCIGYVLTTAIAPEHDVTGSMTGVLYGINYIQSATLFIKHYDNFSDVSVKRFGP